MITLKQLFQVFGHDAKWARFATASIVPMTTVFLRKLGDRDITTLTDFDIELQLAMSDQPEDRKAKARSCIDHLRQWAAEHGKPFAQPDPEPKPKAESQSYPEPKPKAEPKPKREPKPKASGAGTKERKKAERRVNIYDSKHSRGRHSTGTVYHDNASNGYSKAGKRVFKDCWRAEITIAGQRFRHRSKERDDCVAWVRAVKQGKIKPTDNKADWWRMEQRKDDNVRIDEIIVSAAEEAVLLYDYHQTGDITAINDYLVKRLLPHMAWYCAHTLKFGKDRTITASRQAAALLLTRITAGKPVMNFTATCKRMLRVHKERGDFFYYEDVPEPVRLLVNGMNLDALAEVWKVTKDRRI